MSWLQVLEIYGTGYAEDIDSKMYKAREITSHRENAVKDLQDIVKMYDLVLA